VFQQLELTITKKKAPRVSAEDIATLAGYLSDRGWRHSFTIETALNWSKRKVRATAEASGGLIYSYPGSPGFKLMRHITVEEFSAGRRAKRSQIEKMTAHLIADDKVYHAYHHEPNH